jgi:predicted RND superfamily exporter protein
MYIQCLCYMFQPHRAIYRQHISYGVSCTVHLVSSLRYVVAVIINFDVVEVFPRTFCIAAVCIGRGIERSIRYTQWRDRHTQWDTDTAAIQKIRRKTSYVIKFDDNSDYDVP